MAQNRHLHTHLYLPIRSWVNLASSTPTSFPIIRSLLHRYHFFFWGTAHLSLEWCQCAECAENAEALVLSHLSCHITSCPYNPPPQRKNNHFGISLHSTWFVELLVTWKPRLCFSSWSLSVSPRTHRTALFPQAKPGQSLPFDPHSRTLLKRNQKSSLK